MFSIDEYSSDFEFTDAFKVTEDVKKAFDQNGYIILRHLLDSEEVSKLRMALENDEGVMTQQYGTDDGAGKKTKAVMWNHPGNDITGVVARSEKMAGTFEQLLGGEVYHYHAKVIMKEPEVGGAYVWHQDYAYWYENGCMYPAMGTSWLAVDKATKENGCLQILRGSHNMGRLDHAQSGEQAGADLARVEFAKRSCPLLHVELDPGDCLFFHGNVLHRSDQNRSPNRRWAYLVAYNRADNDPVLKHHHPFYTPLNKVENSAIRQCSTTTDMSGKDFHGGPKEDFSLQRVYERAAKTRRD